MSYIIINKSRWPNPFVHSVVPWILKRAGITWSYTATIWNHKNSYSGCGSTYGQRTHICRDFLRNRGFRICRINSSESAQLGFPYIWKDYRYSWAKEYDLRSRVEVFIMVVAHEAYHGVLFRTGKSGKRADNEFKCDDFAYNTVLAYRAAEKDPLKVLHGLRRERQKLLKEKDRVNYRKTPEYKLEVLQDHLKEWIRSKKTAETWIKTYTRKIKYLQKKINQKENYENPSLS